MQSAKVDRMNKPFGSVRETRRSGAAQLAKSILPLRPWLDPHVLRYWFICSQPGQTRYDHALKAARIRKYLGTFHSRRVRDDQNRPCTPRRRKLT